MKIVLWIGNESNQKALANKIHAHFPIRGIILETKAHKPKITLKKVVEKIIEKLFLPSIAKAWWGMKKKYDSDYPNYPNVQILNVENINSDLAFNFTEELNPDLILVSGTRLVKDRMLSLQPKMGILNLHTGLSPYIKGGPNCTNWCIASKQFHLIGNTIMWIDLGIDTGNILTTEFTPLHGNENLPEIHFKVMEHAHSLYVKAVRFLDNGNFKSVAQSSITKGKTYYTKEWTLTQKILLVLNSKKMSNYFKDAKVTQAQQNIKVIEIG
jgi:methionyl-tRNA formyltransferase